MGTMTAPMGPTFLNVPLEVLVHRDLDQGNRDLLETFPKGSAATSTTASGDVLMEPASKKQKLQSEPPVDSAVDALLRAGRKKPPWTPTEQAVVAIKHCELGNRWTQIAAYLPLRSENDVKNIWHSTLRCKDTQKRSFLRTYALAVHDHAYDYPTRKAMFDCAVRQCGPPPQQAAEMIARVQLLMDHPELQAAVQQPPSHSSQHLHSLEQSAQLQHEQLTQLTNLLSSKREDVQHHPQLSQLAQLQQHYMMPPPHSQQDSGAAMEDDGLLGSQRSGDVRRPRTSRDKFALDGYPPSAGDGVRDPPGHDSLLERSGSLQQQKQLQLLLGHGGPVPLRNQQLDGLDSMRGHTESGVSAIRRYHTGAGSGDGGSAGGSGGSFATAPADVLPVAALNTHLGPPADSPAAANGAPTPGTGGPGAAAGGEGLTLPSRPSGVPLPALGNLLALLYKYNIEQTQGSGPGGKPAVEGEDTDGAPSVSHAAAAAAVAAATGLDSATAAAAVAAATAAAGGMESCPDDRVSQGMTASVSTVAGPASQSIAARSLALRPLQANRDGEGDETAAPSAGAGTATTAATPGGELEDDSPKRQASSASGRAAAVTNGSNGVNGNGNGGNKRPHAAMSGQPSGGGPAGQPPPALRPRGSVPYNMQDADADELGAVEALAHAARMNTQSGSRNGAGGVGAAPGAGSAAANGPTGRTSNTGTPSGSGSGLVNLRNGAVAAAAAAAASTRPSGPSSGSGPAPSASQILDLHPPRPSASQQLLPPAPQPSSTSLPQLPPPSQLQPRNSLHLRPPSSSSGDLHTAVGNHPLQHPLHSLPRPPLLQQQQHPLQHPLQNNISNANNGNNAVVAAATGGGQGGRFGPYLDVISVLNMPGLRRQVLGLPAQTLMALLGSPLFGSDSEASVFVLVALWLQANNDTVTQEQIRKLCSAVRLAALGGFYLSAVLPLVLTDPRVAAKSSAASATTPGAVSVRPGNRWFEICNEEVAFLTRYVNAGSVERALLADVAQGSYDCTSPWYDMSLRSMGMPSEGFSFEWHIPMQGLRDALANGAQPHATFSVREDIGDGDDPAGSDANVSIAVVPYIICRGLEWHVFVDCQQRPGGAVAAGVFVYCRVPGVLRPPAGSGGSGVVGVVPGAGIRLGVHGWRCGRLEEVFVWTFGDETYFVPDAGMGCPSALPLRKRPNSPPGGGGAVRGGAGGAVDDSMAPWADYLHDGGLRGTLTFLPP